MKAMELLNLANEAYPEGYLATYYHQDLGERADPGEVRNRCGTRDLLAETIVLNLLDAYRENPDAPDADLLEFAVETLNGMADDLSGVALHLRNKLEEMRAAG